MERARAATERPATRLLLGSGFTVAFVAVAAALIWSIDGLPVANPFLRWLLAGLAAPIWLLTPLVAAVAWRPLRAGHAWLGAVVVGLGGIAVGGVAFWPWYGPALICFGNVVDSTMIFMPGAALVSAVFGGGVALMSLITARLARQGGRWRVVVTGAALQIGLFVVVGVISLEVAFGHICRLAPAQP